MSSIGDVNAVLEERVPTFDPETGHGYMETYSGTRASIEAKLFELASIGMSVRISSQGPLWKIQAVASGMPNGQDEAPSDKWELDTEYVQEDIRMNPKVLAAAVSPITLAWWIKQIEADLDLEQPKGLKKKESDVIDPSHQELYNLKARGVESHEIERPVLRRRRLIGINHLDRMSMSQVGLVWTTAALIGAFNIPPEIHAKLPNDPEITPTGTVWGWKGRTNSSVITLGSRKAEETREWVFAAWPTLLYSINA